MPDRERYSLSSGLPPRLCEGKKGFDTLCELLGIRLSKQKHAIVSSPFVKSVLKANGHTVPRQSKTADRLRLGLLALYRDPEARRTIWRHDRECEIDGKSTEKPIPSLERAALARYDDTVLSAKVDRDGLAECADFHQPDFEEDWRTPALAALPRLRGDIADWASLTLDKRTLVLDAAFAVATLLDDNRLLRWGAQHADDIAEQYAFVVAASVVVASESKLDATQPVGPEPDPFASLRESAKQLAAAATSLAELQPTAELFDAIALLAANVAELRGPALARATTDIVESLIEGFAGILEGKSKFAPWLREHVDEIVAAWRAAYPPDPGAQLDRLRADLHRAADEVEERLASWVEARKRAMEASANLERHEAAVAAKDFPSVSDVEAKVALTAESQSMQRRELEAMLKVVQGSRPDRLAGEPLKGDPTDKPGSLTDEGPPDEPLYVTSTESGEESAPQSSVDQPQAEDRASPPEETPSAQIATVGQTSTADLLSDTASPANAEVTGPSEPKLLLSDGEEERAVLVDTPGKPERELPQDVCVAESASTNAIWEAIGSGRLGLAYQIARVDESGPSGVIAVP